MKYILKDSQLIRRRADHLYNNDRRLRLKCSNIRFRNLFPPLCFLRFLARCRILFCIYSVLMNEVNSTSDNPDHWWEHHNVYHGGNFHGDYVPSKWISLKSLSQAFQCLPSAKLNYLMKPEVNEKLPPLVNLGKLGLNLVCRAQQFHSRFTVAENQTLSFQCRCTASPPNNDNQDIVSMGNQLQPCYKKVMITHIR